MPPKRYKKKPQVKARKNKKPTQPLINQANNILAKPSSMKYYGLNALPASYHCRFKWSWFSQLTTTTQGLSAALGSGYRINSLYDPDAGVGGHQPFFRDQLIGAQLYARYRVTRCVARVIFTNPTQSDMVVGCRLRIAGTSAVSTGLSEDYMREQTRTTFKTLQGVGNNCRVVFDLDMPINKIQGCSAKEVLTDDGYAAAYNADPANQYYLDPWAIRRNAGVGTVDVSINLLYYATLDELIQPNQS